MQKTFDARPEMPSDVHLVATWAAPLEGVPLNERLAAADWTADSEGFLDPRSVATVESTHIPCIFVMNTLTVSVMMRAVGLCETSEEWNRQNTATHLDGLPRRRSLLSFRVLEGTTRDKSRNTTISHRVKAETLSVMKSATELTC